jgi:acyl transferase domain-containing protein/NAD(P)-dependent dehydrogenase (short-subunit alcohol dehydrogenase family)
MLGHTKSAAGITGLMKIALALHHKVLTPTLNVENPNPKLQEDGSPIFANTIPQPWIPPNGVPRRAGVSSFGFGGTNFHAVLEEYLGEVRDPVDFAPRDEWPAELFLWNAASAEALRTSLELVARKLESGARPLLRELAAATCRRAETARDAATRLAIAATSIDDLKAKLARTIPALAGKHAIADPQGVYLEHGGSRPKVAFLFPGQGSQKPGMLSELALHFPEFRQAMEQAEQVLAGRFPRPLSSYIYPPPPFTAEEERDQMQAITDTHVAQPALGVMESALAKLLRRLGVEPDMAAGHSYGEYTALWAAGVLSDEALMDLSEARGRSIKESVQGDMGAMAAVQGDAQAVAEVLCEFPGVIIANDNSPRQLVIAGASGSVRGAARILSERGLPAKMLPVACAFHSALMLPAQERLAAALMRQAFTAPKVAIFSNTLGDRYPDDADRIAALLADHLVRPVNFTGEVRAMYEQGARVFVEVGPKGVLTGLARQTLESTDARIIQIDHGERQGLAHLVDALARLAAAGITVEATQLFRGRVKDTPEVERLLEAEAPPPSAWLVNGGHTFPRDQRPQIFEPLRISAPVEPAIGRVTLSAPAPAAPHQPPAAESVSPTGLRGADSNAASATVLAAPGLSASPNVTAMPMPTPNGNLEAVMLPFQQLMSQFLQTQAAIMTAYLQNAPIEGVPSFQVPASTHTMLTQGPMIPAAPQPGVVPIPVQPERPAQRVTTSPQPAEPPLVAATGPVASSRRDVAAELVKIVSERTGYPVEMLSLDASIEADLGIDSIKRVEILSSFQRLCSQAEQAVLPGMMEKLTSATTLRQIAEYVAKGIQSNSSPAHAPVMPVVPRTEAPGAAVPPPAPRNIAGELVKIVSERTGYPAEMLELDASIEADLGIDSIKRVEILSSFQRLCSQAEQTALQGAMEKLTSATTLRQIAECIGTALALQAPAETSGQTAAVLSRCIPAIAAKPRRGKPRHFPGRVCLITDDETGIAARIAEDLERSGEQPVLLRHSPDATLAANGVQSTDLRNPAAIQALVEGMRVKYGSVGAVIHLLPLRAEHSSAVKDLSDWRERVRLDVTSLYALVRVTEKDLQQTGREGGALLAAVTARGGDFGLGSNGSLAPTHQAIADFMKTAALEIPEARAKVVDIDASDPAAVLHQKLMDELTSEDDTLQVGLPGDRRLVILIQKAPLAVEAAVRIESDWVFLLTGGARGITAAIAHALARKCKPTLVLVGTTPYPEKEESSLTAGIDDPARLKAALAANLRASSAAVKPADIESATQRLLREREIRSTVEELRRQGCRVAYHAADARDETAFGGLIDRIYAEYGRLDVVIHGAGIIEDKLIRDKTPESFDRVVHTKADSAFILSRKLRAESLRCLLLMSSVTAAFGNRGQADYGAANGILNGLALELAARWRAHVVSVNWGPWDQSGMVSEQVRRQFLERGVQPIAPAAGAEAALNEIESGRRTQPAVVSGDGPWVKEAVSEVAARALAVGSQA